MLPVAAHGIGARNAASTWPGAVAEPDLQACYGACRAIVRAHAKTFYLSTRFLSGEKRRAIWAVYAFCRTADDIVDGAGTAAERLAALDVWERGLRAAYAGMPGGPVFAALADAARRYAIPLEPALALLRGARSDVTVDRYATYDALRDYCYLVASTVGLLVMPVLGTVGPGAEEYGVALGRAMQLTNILRDVGDDARMGRVYLPLDELAAFGCTEESVLAGAVEARFRALMRFQIARVRAMYRDAEPGIALLAPDARYTVRLALTLYRGILARIEANGYDVFSRRAHVPLPAKALTAVRLSLTR
jgi:15-cis-phytoene synthase